MHPDKIIPADHIATDEHMDYDYNTVLQRHDTSRDFMGKIVQARLDYLSKLAEAEEFKHASDNLIREGIKQGYTMYAISKKLHMSESAIAYIRDQGK